MHTSFSARRILLLAALGLPLVLVAPAAQAQQPAPNYRLELRSGAVTPPANLDDFLLSARPTDISEGMYVRVVQFWSLPTRERRARLEKAWHVKLLQYLPNNAYVVAFPASFNRQLLQGYSVRSVVKLEPDAKLHPLLRTGNVPAHARRGTTEAELIVQYLETSAADAVGTALKALGAAVVKTDSVNHQLLIRMPLAQIRSLAEVPAVLYVEPAPAPPQPEDRPGRSSHRSNYINSDSPLGRHYDGHGVHVALGDDGTVGPHIDYQGRTDQVEVQGTNSGDHGDHVAGIIMGAGNLDPRQRGMATGAELKVYDPFTNINSSPADYGPFGIRITSTSYGDGCHAGYTTYAQTCDRMTRQHPALLHVFSAGNSGGANCGFPVNGWGTITGGNKTGKNVIAVAALDYHDQLASFSSWGPANDGRIKPDMASVGVDVNSTLPTNTYGLNSGTSMACPGVSGTSAQLYQLWRDRHAGADPDAALIKGALMATADDLGQPGPDFKFGFGRINARRAAITLEDERLFADSIDQGQQRQFSVVVPAGTRQVRVLTYWSDYEGAVLSARDLVNDLDTRLVAPDSTVYRPWVLNPAPNSTTLNAPAVRARDSLNNAEQITLDNPAPGTYLVRVAGTAVPQGAQKFFTFYELLTDSITVTYPMGGESFTPSDAETLRWDAFGNTGAFDLSLSMDGGTTWQPLTTVSGTQRYYDWQPPASRNGQQLMLRVRRGSHEGRSGAFGVQSPPINLHFTRVCPDSATLAWNALPGVARYDIFRLGARFMDSIGTSTAPQFTISPTNPQAEDWVSVRAVSANGAVSRRAIAVRRAPGVVNCTMAFDAGLTQLVNPVTGATTTCAPNQATPVIIRLQNAGAQALTNVPVSYRVGNGPIQTDTLAGPIAPNQTVLHTFSSAALLAAPGTYQVVAWATLPGDGNHYNDTLRATVSLVAGTVAALPHTESVDAWLTCSTASDCATTVCALASGWRNAANGSDDDIDWRVNSGATPSANTGPDVDHTLGNAIGHYLYLEASNGCTAKTAVLTSPCFNLAADSLAQELTFWYHAFGANMGELHVDVLPDSGGAVLDAIPAVVGDQGNQWFQARVPLAAWRHRMVTVRLRGITGSDFASDLALDDFSVNPAVVQGIRADAVALAQRLTLAPNPTTGSVRLSRPDVQDGPLALTVLDMQGRTVWQGPLTGLATTLDLSRVPAGTYAVRAVSARTSVVRRLVVQR